MATQDTVATQDLSFTSTISTASTRSKKKGPADPTKKQPVASLETDVSQVKDFGSYKGVVRSIIKTIREALTINKSLTKENKAVIQRAVGALDASTNALSAIIENTQNDAPDLPPLTPPLSSTTTTSNEPRELVSLIKADIIDCVKMELSKFKEELTSSARGDLMGSKSFADAVRTPKQAVTPMQKVQNRQPSRPALVVTLKEASGSGDKQEVMRAFKRCTNFKGTGFGPSRVLPVSNNKLRVEFDSTSQRDQTLKWIEKSSEIVAEPSKKLSPMFILKGVSKDIPDKELTEYVLSQNVAIKEACVNEGDLKLRFVRNNKKSELYNAVYVATPAVWRAATSLERVNVDHSKVHVGDFSPFLQCFKCLQFGHTKANCKSEDTICSHCALTRHTIDKCPTSKQAQQMKCHNCLQHNKKFNLNNATNHSATSNTCPRLKNMRQRINSRIDFDGY